LAQSQSENLLNPKRSVPLERLHDSPYADVICYPNLAQKELHRRLRELEQLEITAIEFTGEKTVHNTQVLGKGCVGIVVKAFTKRGNAALKIRRTDADRKEMKHEAEMLKTANAVNVGPRFLNLSKNFLLMEYIEGTLFPQWLKKNKQKQIIRSVLRLALEQCWRLDKEGLDHGELSHAPKHVIIKNDTPYIIDFETASTTRKTKNVTAISQYFFIANNTAGQITKKIGKINQERLKQALRSYKRKKTLKNFETVVKTIGLNW
jgi:putative serine/threonine protein kinase